MGEEIKSSKEEENHMDAYAVKPSIEMPFVTSKALKRTPATKENKDRINIWIHMSSHLSLIKLQENFKMV